MSDKITFDDQFDYISDEDAKALSDDEKKKLYSVTFNGVTMYGKPKQKLDTGVPSPEQANVDTSALDKTKEEEKKDREKYNQAATKEDFEFGGDRYGTEEAAASIGKSKAGEDVYGVTGLGSKGEINEAKYQKDKYREEIKEQVDADKQKRLSLDKIENKLKIKSVNRDGEEIYKVGDKAFVSKSGAEDYINREKEKIKEQRKDIGQDETKIAGKNVYKSKSEEIDDALKYRGIGYLNWIRKKGIINDEEYQKYRDQIQEVRDIRKPGIAKALNTAYLIYNAIANGFRNMGNLAFNVAGKGQVQYSQSALGNMLENAFDKAQEVNVAREKGAMEDVFDWQKSKRGLVLDSEKAFRDWGIKARENWSEWDRQTATNVISSFLLKDQKSFDEYMRRTGYAWDKTFAADFGHYLEKKTDAEQQEFISGLFMQAGDNPDALVKMLLSAYTTLQRDAAIKYFFGNKVAEDFVKGAELNDNDVFRKAEAELKRAGYKGAELRKKLDEFIILWNSMKNEKQDKENKQEKEQDKKNENNNPNSLNPKELEGYKEGKRIDANEVKEIEKQAKKDAETAQQTGSFRKGK